ncbi:HEAT repeat domain-containing protein [Pedosphaera parvula]|uniref:PBS lyase HEAT domain protein repeat-containing protein n=1 Tax=Pedosphaera parvula (strain Ellin514) TaxID=320771 RepID=B9XRS9_PEDPL|nr:HEAT repeat domain-containing protein [Pedosphaera parvula]EEF57440.1 hypothetical protein Cflav_PD0551 [Pedosphaera parvula Ellin514]
MTSWQKLLLIAAALILIVLVFGWNRRWFADEPAYKGKTVTEWLDSMALVDGRRKMDRTGESSFETAKSSLEVTNDPALRALVVMGAKAVPVLEKRLSEPLQQDLGLAPWDKLQLEAENEWQKISQPNGARAPAPWKRINSYQDARNTAAALGMLALGTNKGAGVTRLLDMQIQRDPPFLAFLIANRGLPEKHEEIVAGITEGLHNTNAMLRLKAVKLTRTFRGDFQKWRSTLLEMAHDPEEESREAALWALVTTIPKDDEIIRLAEQTLESTNNPPHLRAFAAAGLQLAGEKATRALPLLRQVLKDNTNSFLQSEARRAMRNLEKIASGQTNAPTNAHQ